jgi:putative ABC transport system substrate-binding protein
MSLRRREFIAGLGGAAAWPLAARAQQPAMPVVGYLSHERPGVYSEPEILKGLAEVGFVEGRNVAIDYHWVNGDYSLFPALAADFVRRRVSAIITFTTPAALAAKAATASIPIVFNLGGDPVKLGLVASMNRPGGNITGFSAMLNALTAKRLALLRELVPQAETIAFLVNPTNQNADTDVQDAQAAAKTIGLRILVVAAANEPELARAFTTILNEKAGALLIASDGALYILGDRIVALATRHGVPTMSDNSRPVDGELIRYGPDRAEREERYHQLGVYVGRILKGEKPGDLPVIQPTKFELVINLKTAKALGLTVPPVLRAIATEVIE